MTDVYLLIYPWGDLFSLQAVVLYIVNDLKTKLKEERIHYEIESHSESPNIADRK